MKFQYSKSRKELQKTNNGTGVKIDLMSDLHIEFYIPLKCNLSLNQFISKFIEENINKKDEKDLLIICGDISHSNKISKEFLEQITKLWNKVAVIPGNHDLQDKKLEKERYECLIKETSHIENLIYLCDVVEILEHKNIRIAGTFMSYNLNNDENYLKWKRILNETSFLSREFLNKRNQKDVDYYNKVINEVNIFVSHVPIVNLDGISVTRNLFLNCDVEANKDVLYISGHTHYPKNSIDKESPFNALNVSYGYPSETEKSKLIHTIYVGE